MLEYAPHNLLLRSQEFDNASWIKTNSGGGSAPVVTANAATAPDGTVTADQVVFVAPTSGDQSLIYQAPSTSAGTYTGSFYIKASTAADVGKIIGFRHVQGSGYLLVTLTNSWVRVTLTEARLTDNFEIILRPAIGTSSGTVTIHLWGAQLSVGPYALDYTPTTSAAVYGPRFDYDGSGVTIVEPVSTNLLTYSEQFDNAAWTKVGASVTANSVTSPDGTTNADTITENSANDFHIALQSPSLTSGSTYTLSVFLKAGTRNHGMVRVGGVGVAIKVDLTNGSPTVIEGSPTAYSTVAIGNGWYRCILTFVGVSTNVPQFGPHDNGSGFTYQGNGTGSVYAWGAQLEVGSTATAYMVSGATNGFRAVPVVSGSATAKGLLVEEQRSNLLTYSEQFDNAAWTNTNATVTANAAVAPDGATTADKIVSNSGFEGAINQNISKSGSAITYTYSLFAKAAEFSWLHMAAFDGVSAGERFYFNLASGVVGSIIPIGTGFTSNSSSIVSFGNGWYRCICTFTTTSTTVLGSYLYPTNQDGANTIGNGTSGILVWGAQLE